MQDSYEINHIPTRRHFMSDYLKTSVILWNFSDDPQLNRKHCALKWKKLCGFLSETVPQPAPRAYGRIPVHLWDHPTCGTCCDYHHQPSLLSIRIITENARPWNHEIIPISSQLYTIYFDHIPFFLQNQFAFFFNHPWFERDSRRLSFRCPWPYWVPLKRFFSFS